MPSVHEQLLAITEDTAPSEVARLLTEDLLGPDRLPYRFGINHNVRGKPTEPRTGFYYDYDWVRGRIIGIETRERIRAVDWIRQALLTGYTVYRYKGYKEDAHGSIEQARQSALLASAP